MAKKIKKPASPKPTYNVNLTRMASNNANLRTPSVKGVTGDLPEEGKGFVLMAESLTCPGVGFRLVQTSVVKQVSKLVDGTINFTTENSQYHLEVLTDEEEE